MGDIGNDAIQYEHDDNISLKEGVSLSQVPIDDLPMLTQEPTQSPLPLPSNNSTSTTSKYQKRKSLGKDPTMEQISTNFQNFVDMVSPEFKALA